jgi:glutathione S-transferase
MKLYAHPFSSYCQKVLIALYENETPFEFRMLAPGDAEAAAEHEALWPLKRIPVLVDARRTVVEASVIIEYLDLHHPGSVRLVPKNLRAALDVRMMDRFFDNYIMTPMQKIVLDSMRAAKNRDCQGVIEARQLLDTAYCWLDNTIKGRE